MELRNEDCNKVMQVLRDNTIDLIITDPPYGINYKSNKQLGNTRSGKTITTRAEHYFNKIQNDNTLPVEWIKNAYRILKFNSAMYVFAHWSKWSELEKEIIEAGFKVKGMIVINKSNHGMGDLKGGYAPKHELVMFCTKGRHILNRDGGRKRDVLDLPVKYSGAKRIHPNEKPVSWITPFILESSKTGDTVFDPFAGSAVVGVSCAENDRTFMGCEIEKQYYDDAMKRLSLYFHF